MVEIPLAHFVRGGMVRAAGRESGKKKGGGRKSFVIREPTSAALLFPLLTPCAVHHSAKRDSVERNLLRKVTKIRQQQQPPKS